VRGERTEYKDALYAEFGSGWRRTA
jgi:hypothetical protein